jgi:hypothetical protein
MLSHQDGHHSAVALLLKAAMIQVSDYRLLGASCLMIKLQLVNADIIDDTDTITSRFFRKSFNCRYNPRMDYAFCLLTLKSSEKW